MTSMRRMLACFFVVSCFAAPALAQDPEARFNDAFRRGLAELTARNFDASIQSFKECIDLFPDRPTAYYNIACAYSLMGNVDEANRWLEESMKRGFLDLDHLEADTDLDNIRHSEGFLALIAKYFPTEPGFEATTCPDVELRNLEGEIVRPGDFPGKAVVLFFLNSRSGASLAMAGELEGLVRDPRFRDHVAVLGISNESEKVLAKLAKEKDFAFPLLRCDGDLPAPFDGVKAVPQLFVVDREGKLVRNLVGFRRKATVEQALCEVLGVPWEPVEGVEEWF